MDSKFIQKVEEKDMENVELHRAESIVGQQIEILEQLKQEKNTSVVYYLGNKARSITSRVPSFAVEAVMFMYMFSYAVRSISSTTMIMNKVCVAHLHYSQDVCDNLGEYPAIKSEVEKMANNYHLGHTLVQMVPSALLALFVGSWSDRYGRKVPLIIAQVGIIIDGIGTIICAYYMNSRVEYYYIPALFTGLSGGFIGVLIVLYSYASDISTSGKRTMKYAFMELAFGLSLPLGSLVGGWVFKYYDYITVFVISCCGYLLSLCCVIFFLEETKGIGNKDSWITKFYNLWTLDAVISSFKITAKKRPNRGREQIWLLILAMSIAVFSFAALAGIAYFYVYHKFNWANTQYSTISAVYSVIGLGMMITIVPISKKMNISDPVLGIVGSASMMLKNVGTGLAYKPWVYHLACIAGLLSSLGTLAGRSRISKIVPKDDLGKVFAFLSTAESIFPIVASAVVSQAFNATLDIFPGLIYIVMGTLSIISVAIFLWIARLPISSYDEMENEEAEVTVKTENTEVSVSVKRDETEASSSKY